MFTSANTVYADVKQMLSSFDTAGVLPETDFPRWTATVNEVLGSKALKRRSIAIEIENFKAQKPEDFRFLDAAYLCSITACEGSGTYKAYYNSPYAKEITSLYSRSCYAACDICYEEEREFVVTTVSKTIKPKKYEITDKQLLSLQRTSRAKCSESCACIQSSCEYALEILDNTIQANFQNGYIVFEYYAQSLDEEGYPEVIDNPLVFQALEDFLIYKSYQKMYYNGEADVAQRMQYAENKYREALSAAISEIQTPTFLKLYQYAQKRNKVQDIFHIESSADRKNGRRI